ncbi:MAG TPA: CCA tRNA nucleotidyltransferase [Lachnospiraceae bacterium]|nr:CCA tRNA nucleotidyltransferase [Lachnospiraceae bacterium]
MEIVIPDNVDYIINTLTANGYEAYAVGGCVRDSILGRIPGDWDITTSAKPEEVKRYFRRTVDTGIEHGTVTVMLDKEGYEVTTYRIDGEYEDNRHPKNVEFTSDLVEDLKRRDFTINAMAYNLKEGIVDKFDGLGDIQSKVIRCVGEPMERFDEDALRILRAIRFAAQLDFIIEDRTREAICRKAKFLENISAERIRVELDKLLLSKNPRKLIDAYETGITKVILPEFNEMLHTAQQNPHHIYNVGEHTIRSIECMIYLFEEYPCVEDEKEIDTFAIDKKTKSILCWTMLLHDVGKPGTKTTDENGIDHFYVHDKVGAKMARQILKRLKFDNYTIDTACALIEWHDYTFHADKRSIRRAVSKIGQDIMDLLFLVKKADILAQAPTTQADKLALLDKVMYIYAEIKDAKECMRLKDLAISGKDLIEIGYKQGRELGTILSGLLDRVIEDPELNSKDILLDLVRSDGTKIEENTEC